MDEFKVTVLKSKPKILGITVTWAKAELQMPSSNYQNMNCIEVIGRSAFLMVHKSIPSQPCKELTECGFSDSAWFSITLNSGYHLFIVVCYRTLSSDVNNNEQILHLLNLVDGISAPHLLLMRD